MEIFNNIWFSLAITSIMGVVSFMYYLKGRSAGISDVLQTFERLEPEAYDRAINKLKAKLGENE